MLASPGPIPSLGVPTLRVVIMHTAQPWRYTPGLTAAQAGAGPGFIRGCGDATT